MNALINWDLIDSEFPINEGSFDHTPNVYIV